MERERLAITMHGGEGRMSTIVLSYAFNDAHLANPDGTLAITASGCTVVAGPGNTALGTFPHALSFAGAGHAMVELSAANVDTQKLCVRTLVKVDAPVTSRQNLVEASTLPFAM